MQTQDNMSSQNHILIVGGGIGGIRAAMDLAEAGRDVLLIDKASAIGGLMTQLDRTFPTNNCDLCTLSPHLSETGRQEHIHLMAMTQLVNVTGEVGNFTVTLAQSPRHIDLEKCTACGDCYRKFPECVRFSPGLDHRAPTCMRYPQATPHAYSIDLEKCKDIQALTRICQAGAIVPDQSEETTQVRVGAIILSPGAAVFDPAKLDNFSYGVHPDVVTSLEYERILSASGPTQGQLVRPSTGNQPKKIAWIQCVGSRGLQKGAASYCSSVCCMFSLKEAIVTKERFQQSIETTIFYMDMRTFGKDYERYRERAENEFNVRFVRSRPHSILKDAKTGDLNITFATDNDSVLHNETFDMAVLATGFYVSEDVQRMSAQLGIELNPHHFAQTGSFSPVSTSKAGIFVCGLFESPKDIPETIVQASAAACMAAKSLERSMQALEQDDEPLPQRDVSLEEPKIGFFVCDCGLNIGSVIDTQKLAEYARNLPQVAVSETVGYGCSKASLDRIEKVIADQGLNRVVIGGCSPRTHETKFQTVLKKAGLNKYLLEMANIREQATWVHADNPSAAKAKAEHLVRMAVSSVKKARPLVDHSLSMNKDILVVGGGVTGMNTALTLADQGFKIFLAERYGKTGRTRQKDPQNPARRRRADLHEGPCPKNPGPRPHRGHYQCHHRGSLGDARTL